MTSELELRRFDAVGFQIVAHVRIATRQIFCIPAVEYGGPVFAAAHANEGVADLDRLRMQPGILDAEFSHLPAAYVGPVDLRGQPVVLTDHLALLVQSWRFGQRQPRR